MSKAVQFKDSLDAKQMKLAPDQLSLGGNQQRTAIDATQLENAGLRDAVMDEQFPTADLTAYDPRDKAMVAKLQLQDPKVPGYTPFGKLEAKDSDFEWYQKKQAVAEEANFQLWFAKEFDLMNPVDKQRAKELFPEFYAQRKKLLKIQTKNLFRLAKLKLEGIQNMEDLRTSYLAETGRLDMGPLQNLLNPEKNLGNAKMAEVFQRGLANPFLAFGKEAFPDKANNRLKRAEQFAQRGNMGLEANLGIEAGRGFPPFTSGAGTNGDAQWWKVLQASMPEF